MSLPVCRPPGAGPRCPCHPVYSRLQGDRACVPSPRQLTTVLTSAHFNVNAPLLFDVCSLSRSRFLLCNSGGETVDTHTKLHTVAWCCTLSSMQKNILWFMIKQRIKDRYLLGVTVNKRKNTHIGSKREKYKSVKKATIVK